MKSKKTSGSKNIKFVRVNNTTWIEVEEWIPDEVAKVQFLQKMELSKPGIFTGRAKNESIAQG